MAKKTIKLEVSEKALPPDPSTFVPLVSGTPFGVICFLRTSDGRYLGSDLGYSQFFEATGTHQQKVFTSGYSAFSLWRLKPAHGVHDWSQQKFQLAPDRTTQIRLEHLVTTRNLHSHEPTLLEGAAREVTCYGNFGRGDENDNWKIGLSGNLFNLRHQQFDGVLSARIISATPSLEREEEVYGLLQDESNPQLKDWVTNWEIRFLPIEAADSRITLEIP